MYRMCMYNLVTGGDVHAYSLLNYTFTLHLHMLHTSSVITIMEYVFSLTMYINIVHISHLYMYML